MKNFEKIDSLFKQLHEELRLAQIEHFEKSEETSGVEAALLIQKMNFLKEVKSDLFMIKGKIISNAL